MLCPAESRATTEVGFEGVDQCFRAGRDLPAHLLRGDSSGCLGDSGTKPQ